MTITEHRASDALRPTDRTSCGGCAAEWGAPLLTDLVADLPAPTDRSSLVGLARFDDAATGRVSDDVAIASATGSLPPLVDDPADLEAIAAADACSDVSAVGGQVVTATDVATFPEQLPCEAMVAVIEAGARTVTDAGCVVAGGHTIRTPEPVHGLAVRGVVHPERVLRVPGARAGDVLVASKPVGTGLAPASGTDDQRRAAIDGVKPLLVSR